MHCPPASLCSVDRFEKLPRRGGDICVLETFRVERDFSFFFYFNPFFKFVLIVND